jgi:hypothetical protein
MKHPFWYIKRGRSLVSSIRYLNRPVRPGRQKILPILSLGELACFFCTALQIYSLSFKYLNILYEKNKYSKNHNE